jgi:membrane fusion protein (multidrug efflux system)
MKKKYIVLVLLLMGITLSCKDSDSKKMIDGKVAPVIAVKQRDTVIQNSFVADIQAKKNIEIRSRASGIMEQIFVNEGQFVRKGQRLFKTNDAELRMELNKVAASLKQADADIRIAQIEVSQLQALHTKDFVATNELDLAKAKLASARAKRAYVNAELNAVQQKISFTNIVAPFDGVIDVIPFKEGSLIENGTLLTTLSQLHEVYAYFSIPENMYFELLAHDKMGKHQKIELILPNQDHYEYAGTLKTAEGEIDPENGSIRYKVLFPNPKQLIKHGTSGKLVISEKEENALIIPQKSTFSIQDKTYVFVVDKSLKVKMTNIEIASTLSDSYIVSKGLKIGDKIVLEGTQSLRDGDVIKIKSNNKILTSR